MEWHNDNGYMAWPEAEYANVAATVVYRHHEERIAIRVLGGPSASPVTTWVQGPILERDHWYDFLVKTVWSPQPGPQNFQWWLDGEEVAALDQPTLYTRHDGSTSYVNFELRYYRLHSDWDAVVDFGPAVLGPTRESVDGL